MASFLVLFKIFGSAVAVYPRKSGYPSVEASYFHLELQFLVTTDTRIKIDSQKWVCTAFYGASMDKDD